MKAYKLFAALIFLLLTMSMITSAYTPRGEGFVQVQVYAVNDDLDNLIIGNNVDFSLIIQNYWNDTMSNITVTQEIPVNTELISIVGQTVEGSTNFTDLSVTDEVSGNELQFTYLNTTSTIFTANLDMTLFEDEFISINFEFNFTETGNFNIEAPTLSYYDHWGDLKTTAQTMGTSITINEEDVEPRRQYIPTFETTDPNYTLLIGGLLAIFAVAILGRLLHFKKPVRL